MTEFEQKTMFRQPYFAALCVYNDGVLEADFYKRDNWDLWGHDTKPTFSDLPECYRRKPGTFRKLVEGSFYVEKTENNKKLLEALGYIHKGLYDGIDPTLYYVAAHLGRYWLSQGGAGIETLTEQQIMEMIPECASYRKLREGEDTNPRDYDMDALPEALSSLVAMPKHYIVFPEYGLEVRDINKRFLDNIQESRYNMSLDEAGWWQQAMQYFMRFYAKNGVEDLEKGVYAMNIVIAAMKERKEQTNG
jgi:hypothetical protein